MREKKLPKNVKKVTLLSFPSKNKTKKHPLKSFKRLHQNNEPIIHPNVPYYFFKKNLRAFLGCFWVLQQRNNFVTSTVFF